MPFLIPMGCVILSLFSLKTPGLQITRPVHIHDSLPDRALPIGGGRGGAMVLGKLPALGCPTNLD